MPALSRWMIRISLVNGWLGLTLAMLLLSFKGVPDLLPASIWRWVPAHIVLLLIGWMVQMALGTAYWILPRLPNSLRVRGRFGAALTSAICLNAGVWLFVGSFAWLDYLGELQTIGLSLQVVAIVAFFIHAWPRIRPSVVSSS